MPAQEAAAAPGAGEAQQPGVFQQFLDGIFKLMMFMMVYNMIFGRGQVGPATNLPEQTGGDVDTLNQQKPASARAYRNLLQFGDQMELQVYVDESDKYANESSSVLPLWTHKFTYGNFCGKNETTDYIMSPDWTEGPNGDATDSQVFTLPASETVRNNGSVYMHLVFAGDKGTIQRTWRLNTYLPVVKEKKVRNLLGQETEQTEDVRKEEEGPVGPPEVQSHWHPNLTISLCYNNDIFSPRGLPPNLLPYITFRPKEDVYEPIVYQNDFWNMKKEYMPINSTVTELTLRLTYQPLSMIKWQFFQSMDESFRAQTQFGSMKSGEMDMLKEMLLENSPWLLGLTAVVTTLHSVFDFLAFKNDIQFWRNRKSVEGLSVRTIFTNLIFSTVILLYLYDNDTSYMILISNTIGLGIEFWKITKAVHVKVDTHNRILGIIPRISFTDRATYKKTKTKEYDELAFRYLSKVCFPLVAGYSVYSLVYSTHKSWYSWILSSLVGAIYTFGFIMMTPQLFINYKLKSVAHMPWRMMTYKALNTFIDDLFAFIIKMPWLHRLACLRDDVIFFIYLYQRRIYPVDPTRRNEFQGGDDLSDDEGEGDKTKKLTGWETKAVENGGKKTEENGGDKKTEGKEEKETKEESSEGAEKKGTGESQTVTGKERKRKGAQ